MRTIKLLQTDPGFTLVELLVVISVIGLLSSIMLVAFTSQREKARLAGANSFASQVDRVLGDQTIGLWDFDECSGLTAIERSKTSLNASMGAPPPWSVDTPSGKGCSLGLDGVRSATVNNSASLAATSALTISLWFKWNASTGGQYQALASRWGNSNSYALIFDDTNNELEFWAAGLVPSNNIARPVSIKDSKWHHTAAVYDGESLALYLDGHRLGASLAATGLINDNSQSLRIGADGTITFGAAKLNGVIDSVHLFAKGLMAQDVRQLYLAEKQKFLSVAMQSKP